MTRTATDRGLGGDQNCKRAQPRLTGTPLCPSGRALGRTHRPVRRSCRIPCRPWIPAARVTVQDGAELRHLPAQRRGGLGAASGHRLDDLRAPAEPLIAPDQGRDLGVETRDPLLQRFDARLDAVPRLVAILRRSFAQRLESLDQSVARYHEFRQLLLCLGLGLASLGEVPVGLRFFNSNYMIRKGLSFLLLRRVSLDAHVFIQVGGKAAMPQLSSRRKAAKRQAVVAPPGPGVQGRLPPERPFAVRFVADKR